MTIAPVAKPVPARLLMLIVPVFGPDDGKIEVTVGGAAGGSTVIVTDEPSSEILHAPVVSQRG